MATLAVEGGRRISGEVRVRGAKNAALPLLVAAACGSRAVRLTNLPTEMADIRAAIEALRHLGCQVSTSDGGAEVELNDLKESTVPPQIAGKFRGSLLLLGLLVGRFGRARIALPGGCDLGDRGFDLHLTGLRALGATVEIVDGYIDARATELRGADVQFYLPSTTATENVMVAACFARGRTRIFNAHTRPEVADLATCLNSMGARITVRNRIVEVEGGRPLTGADHAVVAGWDEAVTYVLAAAMTRGELCVKGVSTALFPADVRHLRDAGVEIFDWGNNVYVSARKGGIKPFDLFTAPYPGVNSDMQPLFAAFASQCSGESTITDQRFTERLQYVDELQRLGMDISSYGNTALVRGGVPLAGTSVKARDLRCGAALVLAGLVAEGRTTIENADQLLRGYEYLTERLASLGGSAVRLT